MGILGSKKTDRTVGEANVDRFLRHMYRRYDAEDPLDLFRRFNLGGLDYKGQLSSGYGAVGGRLGLSVDIDLGTLVLPGIVRFPLHAGASLESTKQNMLVVTRMPSEVYEERITGIGARPGAGADRPRSTHGWVYREWQARAPISLMAMTGNNERISVDASIGAEIGAGDPFETDEAGLAAGVRLAGEVTWQWTTLIDPHTRVFESPADSLQLREVVDDLLVTDLKAFFSLWLASSLVASSPKSWSERIGWVGGEATDLVTWLNGRWASAQHAFPVDGSVGFVQSVGNALISRSPSTTSLVKLVDSFENELLPKAKAAEEREWSILASLIAQSEADLVSETAGLTTNAGLGEWRSHFKSTYETSAVDFNWQVDPGGRLRELLDGLADASKPQEPAPTTMPAGADPEASRLHAVIVDAKQLLGAPSDPWPPPPTVPPHRGQLPVSHRRTLIEMRRHRYDIDAEAAQTMRTRLKARKEAKNTVSSRPQTPRRGRPGGPSMLQITGKSGGVSLTGAVKAKLPHNWLGVDGALKGEAEGRRFKIRFQAGGANDGTGRHFEDFVSDVPVPERANLMLTQDTVITQNIFSNIGVSASGSLQGGGKKRPGHKGRGFGAQRYATVSFRSVSAYWLLTEPHKRGSAKTAKAYPNGSGVTFGLSVDAFRLGRYAQRCVDLNGANTDMDGPEKIMEELLAAQLRIDRVQLRGMLIDYPLPESNADKTDYDELGGAVVVEAGHAFLKTVTLPVTQVGGIVEPVDLFDVAEAKARLSLKNALSDTTTLQVLRVRRSIAGDEEFTRGLFSFGWTESFNVHESPKPDVTEPVPPIDTGGQLDAMLNLQKQTVGTITPGMELKRVRRVGSEAFFDLHTKFATDIRRRRSGRGPSEELPPAVAQEFAVPPVTLWGQDR